MTKLPEKELLRVDEVADYFSVSPRTVRLWLEHGKLREARTPGGALRILRDTVDEWMQVYRGLVE